MKIEQKIVDTSIGCEGDIAEMLFKPLTAVYLSRWWLFREAIRGGGAQYLMKNTGEPAPENIKDNFEKLGIIGYTVYHAAVHAFLNACDAGGNLSFENSNEAWFLIEFRRYLRAFYESLYVLTSGIANTYAILFLDHDFANNRNYMVGQAINSAKTSGNPKGKLIGTILEDMETDLVKRHQEVHFWVTQIGIFVDPIKQFVGLGIDAGFTKGELPIGKGKKPQFKPALPELLEILRKYYILADEAYDIFYNQIDTWLQQKELMIDYGDFEIHGKKKPTIILLNYDGEDPMGLFIQKYKEWRRIQKIKNGQLLKKT